MPNPPNTPDAATGAAKMRPEGAVRPGLGTRLRSSRLGAVLALLVLLAAGAGGYLWWLHVRNYESTDNAYVHVSTVPVGTRIEGMVQEVLVQENQAVRKGDLLVRLDPALYKVAVESAEAEVAVALARFESSKLSAAYSSGRVVPLLDEARARHAGLLQTLRSEEALLRQRRNETQAAAATRSRAKDELARKRKLHGQKVISDELLDQAVAAFRVADAQHKASLDAYRVEQEKVGALKQQDKELRASIQVVQKEELSAQGKSADVKSLEAELKQAEAKLRESRLKLSYTEIRAPEAGYVNKKAVEPGTYVEPGRPLLLLVPLHNAYLQANFKEVQLESIRVGQPAVIIADAYPHRTYRGHVESIYSGTGDAFSLLPAENATGNWVKVTRRVPVKIVLDEPPSAEFPLLVGMSALVRVDIRDQSGARLLPYPARAGKDDRRSASGERRTSP